MESLIKSIRQNWTLWPKFMVLSLVFLLTACGGSDDDTSSDDTSSFALPSEIQAAKLETTGILATLSVDGGTPQDMVVTDTGATITLTVTQDTHTFTIEFSYDDPTYGIVTLASATRTFDVTTSSTISFVDTDYTYADDDNDGFSNLYELDNGTNPFVAEPRVTSTTPAGGDVDVALDTTISAVFSNEMDATTLTTTSFTLEGATGGAVTGTVSYDSASSTATFTPGTNLDDNVVYTATLTTAILDTSGVALPAAVSWSFTTVNQIPTVTATVPADGALDIAADTPISATFNDPMDAATLTTTTFTVTGDASGPVSGSVTYDAASQTASFTPTNVLNAYESYTATLSTAVQDDGGLGLAAAVSWSFTIQEPPVMQVSDIRTAGSNTTPTIVYNDAGDGVAVWMVSTSAGQSLLYSLYDGTTGTWSSDTVLSSSTSTFYDIQVATNGNGYAVVWRQHNGSAYDIYASTFDGTDWSTPAVIDSEPTSGYSLQLVSNGTGYAAVWGQTDSTGNSRIFGSISSDGTTWGASVSLDNSSTTAYSPRLASNGSGYAVIWSEYDVTYITHVGVRIYSGSSWNTPELLDTDNGSSANSPYLAGSSNGYSVTWYKYDSVSTTYSVYDRTYYDTGGGVFGWSAETEIDNTTNYAFTLGMISNGTGYAVLFYEYDLSTYTYNFYAVTNTDGNQTWGSPAQLQASIYPNAPRLATDGTTYAVAWSQYDGSSTYDVYASVFNGSTWSSATTPIETASAPVYSPQIAGYNSQYVVSWHQEVSGVNSIFANVYDSTSGWGNVQELETGDGTASSPLISTNPTGILTVAWNQEDSTGTSSASYTNNYDMTSWSGTQTLVAATYGGSSYDPQLVTNASNKTLAVWSQDLSGKKALYANIFANGTWGTPQLLADSSTSYDTNDIQIASDGNGFAVVWEDSDGSYYSIYAAIHNGTAWETPQEVDDPNMTLSAYLTKSYNFKSIASNGSGYMLVYQQYDISDNIYKAFARHFDGSAWGLPVLLDDMLTATPDTKPQIVSNGTEYLVVWGQYDGTYISLYSNEFKDNAWGTTQLVENLDGSVYNYAPRLISNDSNYLAVWSHYDTTYSSYNVYSNFYTNGSWETASARDPGSDYSVYSPPLTSSTGNGYLIAWEENNSTGRAIKAEYHDGTTWTGVVTMDDGTLGTALLDDASPFEQLVASGNQYALLWRRYNTTDSVYDLYVNVFDSSDWLTSPVLLETGSGTVSDTQLASNGLGFLAAWRQDDGAGTYDVLSNRYELGTWSGVRTLDEGSSSAFDLQLSGGLDGYSTIWTQPEPNGDETIRFPWAKVGF